MHAKLAGLNDCVAPPPTCAGTILQMLLFKISTRVMKKDSVTTLVDRRCP